MANPNLSSTKSVNLNFAAVGETLNYSVNIGNSGDTDAFNVILTDLIPQGANFLNDTVKVNGTPVLGANPALGINVGTIPISNLSVVTFQALVVTIPYTNSLVNYGQVDYQYIDPLTTPSTVTATLDSNSVTTTINSPLLQFRKSSVTTTITGPGQVITYDLVLTNAGNANANNVVFLDTTPTGTSFVPDSIYILTTNQPGATIAPPSGFSIGNLPANNYTTLSFKVTVVSVPANYTISNICDITYNFTVDPITPRTVNGRQSSNTVNISQSTTRADLSGIFKTVNKAYATLGDILSYTITIPNSGTTTAYNVFIVDTAPNGTAYVPNTLRVNNNLSTSPLTNIYVGTIAAGTTATVQFDVSVTG